MKFVIAAFLVCWWIGCALVAFNAIPLRNAGYRTAGQQRAIDDNDLLERHQREVMNRIIFAP